MKKINFSGLKTKFFFYFALFLTVLIALLWIFQIVFYRISYEKMKKIEVEKIGQNLVTMIGRQNYEPTLSKVAFDKQLVVIVFRRLNNVIFVDYNSDDLIKDFQAPINVDYFVSFISKLDNAPLGNSITYLDQIDIGSSSSDYQNLIFGTTALVGGQMHYLYVSSGLTPDNLTVQVLQMQFLIISIILFVVGITSSLLLAHKMTRPIVHMSEKALRLSRRDFSVRFDEKGYTELAKLSEALNLATDELSKSENLRRDLLANVSHDLKTPLTMVKGYAEMIKDISLLDEKKRAEHADIIMNEADRLTILINEILNMSKLESGVEKLECKRIKASSLVEKVANIFIPHCEKQSIAFTVVCDENLYINCDAIKLEQVLYNLVSNAINYASEQQPKVEITLAREGDYARFSVKDNGDGIEEGEQAYIWDKYYKSKRNDKIQNSTGLGLYISKCVLQLHKARYGVISELDCGSEFWFEIILEKM